MKLIIDIPEEDYRFIKDIIFYNSGRRSCKTIERNVINGVRNGIPYEERPQGAWSDESKDSLLCSACGKRIYKPFIGGFPTERTSHYYPNFCAFCGADMRGGAE